MDFVQRHWLGIKSLIPGEVFHNLGSQRLEGAASWETPGASVWLGISSLSQCRAELLEKEG